MHAPALSQAEGGLLPRLSCGGQPAFGFLDLGRKLWANWPQVLAAVGTKFHCLKLGGLSAQPAILIVGGAVLVLVRCAGAWHRFPPSVL
jgi:hypothetical protein